MQVHVLGIIESLTFSAGRPAHSDYTYSRPTMLAVSGGGDCLDNFRTGGDCLDILSITYCTFYLSHSLADGPI